MVSPAFPTEPLFPGGPQVQRRLVTELAPDEVMVVPTNGKGIHGMGVAGVAFWGGAGPEYRHNPAFKRAAAAPAGHPDRIGRWCVYGVARGAMLGYAGKSYGVETVTAPGKRGSIHPDDLYAQCLKLVGYAQRRPDLRWLVPPLGAGLAGGSQEDFVALWKRLAAEVTLPDNLIFVRPP